LQKLYQLDKENKVHKIRVVKLHKKRIGYFTRIQYFPVDRMVQM